MQTELKKLLISLTALTALNCGGVPKFPAEHLYEADVANSVCGQYKIVDATRLLFEFEKDLPIAACQGVFGFTPSDLPKVMDWSRDRIEDGKKSCKLQ